MFIFNEKDIYEFIPWGCSILVLIVYIGITMAKSRLENKNIRRSNEEKGKKLCRHN